jgi:hypothetical protein
MFSFIYELFGESPNPEYLTSVFPMVSWLTLFTPLVMAGVYYGVINRSSAGWNLVRHWLLLLLLCAIICFSYALIVPSSVLDNANDYLMYDLLFGLCNAILGSLFLFIASVIIKRFSIFAKNTPF